MESVILLPNHERLLSKKGQHVHIRNFLLKGDSNYALIEFSRRAIILGCRNDYEGINIFTRAEAKSFAKKLSKK